MRSDSGIFENILHNLEEKYPVVYPTTITIEQGKLMKEAILQDFENRNKGYEAWSARANSFYTDNIQYDYRNTQYDLAGLKDAMQPIIASSQRVHINNILISGEWAAIHFWSVVTKEDGTKEAENHMQFLHFIETDGGLKVDLCFAK